MTRATARKIRRHQDQAIARSRPNTLLGLPNEILNLIFSLACDGETIRVSCKNTRMNQEKRELDPKDVEMWVAASDAEEAGMPLDSKSSLPSTAISMTSSVLVYTPTLSQRH